MTANVLGTWLVIVSGTVTIAITQVYQAFFCLNSLYVRSFNPPNLFWLTVRRPHWLMRLNIWSPDGGPVLGGYGAFCRWVATRQKATGAGKASGLQAAGFRSSSLLLDLLSCEPARCLRYPPLQAVIGPTVLPSPP